MSIEVIIVLRLNCQLGIICLIVKVARLAGRSLGHRIEILVHLILPSLISNRCLHTRYFICQLREQFILVLGLLYHGLRESILSLRQSFDIRARFKIILLSKTGAFNRTSSVESAILHRVRQFLFFLLFFIIFLLFISHFKQVGRIALTKRFEIRIIVTVKG